MNGLLVLLALLGGASRDSTHRPAAVVRAPLDTAQVVNFRTAIEPETVYVGQQASYEFGAFVDESVRDRLRRMEEVPPELRGVMAYEPPATMSGFPMAPVGRRHYEAHVSLRAIFPLAPGRYAVAPARLVYAMPLSYSFFSREESFELRSDSSVLVAIDPPTAGRPADWNGAVGVLHLDVRLDTLSARVGDAIHLTVRVIGTGNVKLFPRPALDIAWGSAIPAGERVMLDPDSITIRGTKEFDWELTPDRAGRQTLSPVRYSYFDPYRRRYDVAQTVPIPLSIMPGTLATIDSTSTLRPPAWTVRAEYRGALPLPIYHTWPYLLLMILLPAPAIAIAYANRPHRERRGRRRRPADEVLREVARRPEGTDLSALRRAFLNAVAARLRAPASALAEPEAIRRAARRAGTSGATAASAAAFIAELNTAAFALKGEPVRGAAARALALYGSIDSEARRWRAPAASALVVALLISATAGRSLVAADDARDPAARFAAGVAAYDARHYADAAVQFNAVVEAEPRAADGWADLGTAAFAAGDTATAVRGWQRALRLEPLAPDMRERLDIIAPASAAAPGAVPPIPPLPIILAASLLWAGGWITIALRLRRRLPLASASIALTALGAAVLCGCAGTFLDIRLSPVGLAVAQHDVPLRILPALGGERASIVHLGETVRVVTSEGAWAQVHVDRDRDGWVPLDALMPLSGD